MRKLAFMWVLVSAAGCASTQEGAIPPDAAPVVTDAHAIQAIDAAVALPPDAPVVAPPDANAKPADPDAAVPDAAPPPDALPPDAAAADATAGDACVPRFELCNHVD